MAKLADTVLGAKFGQLTVIYEITEHYSSNSRKYKVVQVRCECGNLITPLVCNLGSKTISCGCVRYRNSKIAVTSHGKSKSRVYSIWESMLKRCFNPNNARYSAYKGKAPPERWRSFVNFLEDMGEPPEGYSLDRKDNSKPYSKENCRWVTQLAQARNKTDTVRLLYLDRSYALSELCQLLNLQYNTVYARLTILGWEPSKAISLGVSWYDVEQGKQIKEKSEILRRERNERKVAIRQSGK